MKYLIFLFFFSLSCAPKGKPSPEKTTPELEKKGAGKKVQKEISKDNSALPSGTRVSSTSESFDASYAKILASLKGDPNTTILAEIDHQKNAKSKGIALAPTRVILFEDRKRTVSLIDQHPLSGLDLPQRVLVFKEKGETKVLTNSDHYLMRRYELAKAVDSTFDLKKIGVEESSKSLPYGYQGLEILKSKKSFDETYKALKMILEKNENLNIMAEHDFAKSNPMVKAKLIVFGNPKLGTPLMMKGRSIALDLPQKMLVYSYKDTVHVAYNSPDYLLERHSITHPEIEKKIKGALGKISSKAAE